MSDKSETICSQTSSDISEDDIQQYRQDCEFFIDDSDVQDMNVIAESYVDYDYIPGPESLADAVSEDFESDEELSD